MNAKQIAAECAAAYIQSGMTVGLGTGSTAAYAIHALGRQFQTKPFDLRCIATSQESQELGSSYGLPFVEFEEVHHFDITIDGADEVDPEFRLIKGGGGALVREKVVAAATEREIIIVDDSKVKPFLGLFPLPVAILPFGWERTQAYVEKKFGVPAPRRMLTGIAPFLSDDGLFTVSLRNFLQRYGACAYALRSSFITAYSFF